MSHYQSKGDRSEAQLKKAGRSSGPGHQRSGVPSSAVKGGGAGGPSPSGSAHPAPAAPLGGSQPPAAALPARPTTPASSTNRGGKRASGPAGAARNAPSGIPADYGGSHKAPQFAGLQYSSQPSQQQQQQGLGPSDAHQHPATSTGQQPDMKQAIRPSQPGSSAGGAPPKQPYVVGSNMASGAAGRPPPPSVPPSKVVGAEPVSPLATSAVDTSRVPSSPIAFQFGSITPGFTGVQIPARTSSAPPNLHEQMVDEQKQERLRDASRGSGPSKVPMVPSMPPQSRVPQVPRVVTITTEPPPAVQQPNIGTLGAPTGVPPSGVAGVQAQQQANHQPGLAQQTVQYSQGQVHPVPLQGHQLNQQHMPNQQQMHIHLAAQAQAQAHHSHQQVLAQQALPQQALPQQGMVQQNLSQGMKYAQSMMTPPHGAQMISQQIGNPMAGQLSGQQGPPQMTHQLGPQMGGTMGGQLPPGISGAQYAAATGQFIQPQRSRAVKIVHPETHEELRFDAKQKKGDPFLDAGSSASASVSAGLPVRVASNGPPQPRAPVTYGSGPPHHGMVPSYFQPIQGSYPAPYFQSVPPPKSGVPTAGGPPSNTPSVRYGAYAQTPAFLPHSGAVATAAGSKVVPTGGLGISIASSELSSATPSSPIVGSPSGSAPSPPPPAPPGQTSAVPVPGRVTPLLAQPGGNPSPSSNGRPPSVLVPGPTTTTTAVPVTPLANSTVAFKFGDVETSGSTSTGDSSGENLPATQSQTSSTNGSSSTAVAESSASAQTAEGLTSRRDAPSRAATPSTLKPVVSVPLPKSGSVPSGSNVSSPKVASSGVSATTAEKSKAETSKPAVISRENSRKLSKKEKQQRQQQQQQQASSTTAAAENEADKKVEATYAAPVVPASVQTGTEKVSAASPKVALQRTHSGVQSNPASQVTTKSNASGKSEEGKGTPKVPTELEKRAGSKSSAQSPSNSEVGTSGQAHVSSDGEESSRKSISKQGSGKSLASSKSLEGKDLSVVDASSGGKAPKLSSSSAKALATTSAVKEASVWQGGEVSPKKVQAPKPSQSNEALKETVENVAGEIPTSVHDVPIAPQEEVLDFELVSKMQHASTEAKDLIADASTSPNETSEYIEVGVDSLQAGQMASNDKTSADKLRLNGNSDLAAPSSLPLEERNETKERNIDDTPSETQVEEVPVEVMQPIEDKGTIVEPTPLANVTGIGPNVKSGHLPSAASELEKVLGSEKISLVEAVAKEKETLESSELFVFNYNSPPLETARPKGVTTGGISDIHSSSEPRKSKYKPSISVNVENLLEASDSYGSINPSGDEGGDAQRSGDNPGIDDHNLREGSESLNFTGLNAEQESTSSAAPEVKAGGSKKKKKKEIFAKADAQGPTADLFTAYKAPEEKKADEQVKKAETPGSSNTGGDSKKDSSSIFEKPILKELDDWEDAAELPTPKITPGTTNASSDVSVVAGEAPNPGPFGVRKYTRDFLLTQQSLHRDLPAEFEIRADIAELLLTREGHPGDALPSPGRGLDRQSSAGARLDRRNSNVGAEEDRWTRQQPGGVSSPGRGPPDGPMGMAGPPGGFRPGGQGRNAGLMGMPPGMRPNMGGPQGIMPMVGLLSGGPLLSQHNQMMMQQQNPGPGRQMGPQGGIDADRWQRAPVAQKGLIPSPRTPLPAIHKTENRYQVGKISDEEQMKQRLIKGILNKLTPQNFDKLFVQVQGVHIDSATTLTGVISQIFDKALTEPTFCEMYAKFCVQLAVELPEFTEDDEKITFKRVLLNKCQEEFERGEREQEEAEKVEEDGEVKLTAEEREEKRVKARRRMLGNIRFIGELYKNVMLTERIMHECIKKLLGEYQNPDEEDVEALCKLMSTIGRIIDHAKAKEHIDAYFKRMENLSENSKLSARLRFMLKDVIDLRRNAWQERRKVEGPKKIDEVHRDAVNERQAAASGRDRMQQRGAMAPGGVRRPGNDFMRGTQPPMFPAGGQMVGNMPMGGMRGAPMPQGAMRGGGYGQDVRMEDRLVMDRPVPMPLSQRPSDEGPLTLGPQGGLGRGMASRGPPLVSGRSALADVPPPMSYGESRRAGMGPMSGYGAGMISDRGPYGGRDDVPMRGAGAERPLGPPDRPLLERPHGPDRLGPPLSGRDMRGPERPLERPRTPLGGGGAMRPMTPPAPVAQRLAPTAVTLSEDELKKKSLSTILEFYSVRDVKEATQCVDDLKAPKFHPTMLSMWVTDALEKKDTERELLMKLIVHLRHTGYGSQEGVPLVTSDQIYKGFEIVLSTLEDITVDVPRAPDYVAGMFAKLIVAGIFSLPEVGKLLREGGMDAGSLLKGGDALIIFGGVLDTFRKEKGEDEMITMYRTSGLYLENFLSPDQKRQGDYFESFLEKKCLQCLYPMIPVERYLRGALDRDEPAADILKWMEKNVPQPTCGEPAFLLMIMKQVLRYSVPFENNKLAPHFEKSIEMKIKKYASLMKKFAGGKAKTAEANQRQYLVAVQLFGNEVGYAPGLFTPLFSSLYKEDVISEQAFLKWQDDVEDSTPGRELIIKDAFKWFRWLVEAPEDGGEEED